MPRGIFNWTFRDVVNVLQENGFEFGHARGSHHFYVKPMDKPENIVCVPFHGSTTIAPYAIKNIISQSGLSKSKWGIR